MLGISKELFDEWNGNVCYCHWKSNEHLEEGLNGITDLDVLLSQQDKEKGSIILKKLNFLRCKAQYGGRYPDVDDWIGFDASTGKLIHLHLHYQIITGSKGMKEYILPWTEECLKTRVIDSEFGVFVADPNIEIVTLYTRIVLKVSPIHLLKLKFGKYNYEKFYSKEIDFLKGKVVWDVVLDNLRRYFGTDAESILQIIKMQSMSVQQFMTLRKYVLRHIVTRTKMGYIKHEILRWFFLFILPLRKILRYKYGQYFIMRKVPYVGNGASFAFLGQDGSGKSRVTTDIEKWLSWKLDARRFYFGSGEHYNPWQKRLMSKIKNNHFFLKFIYNVLKFSFISSWSKYVYRLMNKAQNYIHHGGIAIYDRFPQVEFYGINDGPKIPNQLIKIRNCFFYKIASIYAKKEDDRIRKVISYAPNVVFKLLLSTEESLRRKPQENYETVKRKHDIIKQLKFEESDVYEIDATQDYNIEILKIKEIIWNHLIKL